MIEEAWKRCAATVCCMPIVPAVLLHTASWEHRRRGSNPGSKSGPCHRAVARAGGAVATSAAGPSWPVSRARVPFANLPSSVVPPSPVPAVAAHQTGGGLLFPIVGGLSLELHVWLCRGTSRASGADAVREGGPMMSTADTANVFKVGPEGGGAREPNLKGAVLATEGTENESPGAGVRLSTRRGPTGPHTIPPSNEGPGVMKVRSGGGADDPNTARELS